MRKLATKLVSPWIYLAEAEHHYRPWHVRGQEEIFQSRLQSLPVWTAREQAGSPGGLRAPHQGGVGQPPGGIHQDRLPPSHLPGQGPVQLPARDGPAHSAAVLHQCRPQIWTGGSSFQLSSDCWDFPKIFRVLALPSLLTEERPAGKKYRRHLAR